MNVHTDLSFVTLIVQASFIVQAVIALLAILSLWSWWQIFLKLFQLRRATRETDLFEDEFWKGGDLTELFQRASQMRVSSSCSVMRVCASTLAKGSSMRSTSGLLASARATPTRCCMPPDRSAG